MKFTTLFAGVAFIFTTSLVMAAGQAPAAMEPGCCATATAHVVSQDHLHEVAVAGCCEAKDGTCAMCAKSEDGKAGCADGSCNHEAAEGGCCDKAGDADVKPCCDKAAQAHGKTCCNKAAAGR